MSDDDHDGDLEHQLLRTWSPDELAVYADRLQDLGDPRGELVALDLTPSAARGRTWEQARVAALDTWLGRDLAKAAAPFVRFGFLEDLGDNARSAELLASPAGAYVRTYRARNDVKTVQESIERLAARPRPWLQELTIHLWSDTITNVPRLDRTLVQQLIAHTPHLQTLDLSGRLVIDSFPHPHLPLAIVSGVDAARHLNFPAVEILDLAFHRVHRVDVAKTPRPVLDARELPALVQLDLSRNEPGRRAPHRLRGDLDPYDALDGASILEQLEQLVVPALRDEPSIVRLAHLVTRMPKLVRARVARAYRGTPHRVATQRLAGLPVTLPAVRPWPHPHAMRGGISLVGQDQWNNDEWLAAIELRDTFDFVDRACEPSEWGIWDAVWTALAELPARGDAPVPYEVLARALASGGERLLAELPDWRPLASALKAHASRKTSLALRRMDPRGREP